MRQVFTLTHLLWCTLFFYPAVSFAQGPVDAAPSFNLNIKKITGSVKTNGFFFVVNAYNVQSDDILTANSGTDNGMNFSWDNKWLSATRIYPDRWTAEIAIPFKTLRYTPGKTVWGINFLRIDIQSNEYSTWSKVPRNFRSYDLGYTGLLSWDAPPPRAGSNIAIIP